MLDINFRRGVVLLCNHNEEGTLGFVLNKPIEMNITDLITTFPTFKSEVYYGGPLQTDTIHYLHDKGELLDDAIEVLPNLYWGGDFDQLKEAIEAQLILPEDIRFYVGFAGWESGQLQAEQEQASWLTVPAQVKDVLNDNWASLWKDILIEDGGTYEAIGRMGSPFFN